MKKLTINISLFLIISLLLPLKGVGGAAWAQQYATILYRQSELPHAVPVAEIDSVVVRDVAQVDATYFELNKEKIDKLNRRLYDSMDEAAQEAFDKIDEGQQKIDEGRQELENAKAELEEGQQNLNYGSYSAREGFENAEEKLRNLKTVYESGISHKGYDTYAQLDARYTNRIIATKK